MKWRLGIDLGTNSLGWWAFEVHKPKRERPGKITKSLGGGVYIFPDGREPAKGGRVGDSNAVQRRQARSMRGTRDRGKTRLRAYMKELVALKLMPKTGKGRDQLFQTSGDNPHAYNPYRLRAEAMSRPLTPYELGRALFHLGLRRGYKSNRIAQEADDDEGGQLRDGMNALSQKLGPRTLGQFLWEKILEDEERHKQGFSTSGIRFRGYDEFYPNRKMYEQEFEAIREKQTSHHNLKPDDWDRLRDRYVLFQWPLDPVERGRCRFYTSEPRHWQDTPIGHDFRIYQELNNLRWFDSNQKERALDAEQRDTVLKLLTTRRTEISFDALRKQRKANGEQLFADCTRFNLEIAGRKGLKPHAVATTLAKEPALAPLWERRYSENGDGGELDDIYEALLETNEQEELRRKLSESHKLAPNVVEILLRMKPPARSTAHVSRKFMEKIVPILRDQGLVWDKAVRELTDDKGEPLHHSFRSDLEKFSELPYYGEVLRDSMLGADPSKDSKLEPEKHFGKIGNPTVHIALNSLRRVVNDLIDHFGFPPAEIHVELARELKQPRSMRDEISKQQARERKRNDDIRAMFENRELSGLDIKKIKLWEELGNNLERRCPFSGEQISCADLWNGDAEIEHILPFSRTLDDSMANLTIAKKWANQRKGNRTPYEAFHGNTERGILWETVQEMASRLPPNKQWRFGPDAMRRYEEENDFLARQLTDNAYIARAAMEYLGCLSEVEHIVPNRGRLTALLRGKWRLNTILSDRNVKNREDHRHHAIDAAVVGLTNRSLLNKVSRNTARGADGKVKIQVPDLDEQLFSAIQSQVHKILVAFKQDHGWQGPMYKQSAYGFIPEQHLDPDLPDHQLVVRKPLVELEKSECARIRDRNIREKIRNLHLGTMSASEMKQALVRFSDEHGIRRIRILVKDQTVRKILSAPYKGYAPKSYVCCDVWRKPKGKPGAWKPNVYEYFGHYWPYTETADGIPPPKRPDDAENAKFVMRLFKDDMVEYNDEHGRVQIMRVAGFSTTNNKLAMALHTEANPGQSFVSINVLGQRRGLRKIWVGPRGQRRGPAK